MLHVSVDERQSDGPSLSSAFMLKGLLCHCPQLQCKRWEKIEMTLTFRRRGYKTRFKTVLKKVTQCAADFVACSSMSWEDWSIFRDENKFLSHVISD